MLIKRSIYLSCVWSNLSEDIVVDNEAFTDLNPQQSNDWSVTLFNTLDKCDLELTDLLYKFADQLKRTITVSQLLRAATSSSNLAASSSSSQIAGSADDEQARKALDRLATAGSASGSRRIDRVVNLGSNIVEKATNRMKINLNDETVLPLDKGFLDYIMDVRRITLIIKIYKLFYLQLKLD